jgi:hypothetical protein
LTPCTSSVSALSTQFSQTPFAKSFSCITFQKTPRGWGPILPHLLGFLSCSFRSRTASATDFAIQLRPQLQSLQSLAHSFRHPRVGGQQALPNCERPCRGRHSPFRPLRPAHSLPASLLIFRRPPRKHGSRATDHASPLPPQPPLPPLRHLRTLSPYNYGQTYRFR